MKRKGEAKEAKQNKLEEQKADQDEEKEEQKEEVDVTKAPIKYSVVSLPDCNNGSNKGVIYIGKLV